MEWLNYHHFRYFWLVVREGGVVPASRVLRISHPSVSAQLKQLEEALGEPLFDRSGRRLELTEAGRVAYRYADEIFSLGVEFLDVLRGADVGRPIELRVGITDVMPKLVVRRLLDPALRMDETVRLSCTHDQHDRLVAQLALHSLDVVLADAPVAPSSGIRAYNHPLGECGVTFFAAPALARKLGADFPACLDRAPFLAPAPATALARALTQWFDEREIRPHIAAEFDDSALMKTFGADGVGVFCTPAVVEAEVRAQYGVEAIGATDDILERFYAISMERRVKNVAVSAVCEGAKDKLFGPSKRRKHR